jgi:hypothetical protein
MRRWLFLLTALPLSNSSTHFLRASDAAKDTSHAATTATNVTVVPPAAAANMRYPLHARAGTQHVFLWIGEPPVRQTLIVDTGSRFAATVCEGCRDCGLHANAHLPANSSTRLTHACTTAPAKASHLPSQLRGCLMADRCDGDACLILQKYTEGSTWKATEVNDIVALGAGALPLTEVVLSASTTAFSFGCQTEVTGLFRQQYADGILGLERTAYSLIQTMKDQGVVDRASFSICLHAAGGWLAVGGAQTDRHATDMRWTAVPLAEMHAWHSVVVEQVWLGDVLVADNVTAPGVMESFHLAKGTILDSGTTDTYLPARLRTLWEPLWEQQTGISWRQRTRMYTHAEYQRLPEIHLMLQGNVTLTISPEFYMEGAVPASPWRGQIQLTNRVYTDENIGAVLGLNAMMGYDIYYDGEGQRIGIAKADCTSKL